MSANQTSSGLPLAFDVWYNHPPMGSPINLAIAIGRNANP